jgi:hypothetical protein
MLNNMPTKQPKQPSTAVKQKPKQVKQPRNQNQQVAKLPRNSRLGGI